MVVKASLDVLLKLNHEKVQVDDSARAVVLSQKSPIDRKMELVRARLERFTAEDEVARDAGEAKRQRHLFECVIFVKRRWFSVLILFRALEGIKEKLQKLSDRSTPGDHTEDEEDVIDVDEVMNNLNDAIVEYQVGDGLENTRLIVHSPRSATVLATEGNLRSKL